MLNLFICPFNSVDLKKKQELTARLYEAHVKVFNDLDEYGSKLAKSFSDLKTFEGELEKSKEIVQANLVEFSNLHAW